MNIGKLLDSHLFAFVTIVFMHNALRATTTVHKDITHESTPHMITRDCLILELVYLNTHKLTVTTVTKKAHKSLRDLYTPSQFSSGFGTQNPVVCALLVSCILAICQAHFPVLTVHILGPKLQVYWVYHEGSATLRKNVPSVNLHR